MASVSSLTAIRNDYIRRFRPRARAEAAHFAQGSPEERVQRAALAVTANGHKHRHQWRIPPSLLTEFARRLLGRLNAINAARSFPDLLAVVTAVKLKGVSDLTIYDTTVRIGGGQHIEPDAVYLHAGTRKGAARLGLNVRRVSIPLAEMPPEFKGLSASEMEDLLCSYARYFGSNAEQFSPPACGKPSSHGCGPVQSAGLG